MIEMAEVSQIHLANPLSLVWSFGINRDIPVLNLSSTARKGLFYITGHTGVLYNFEANTQVLYQGHCNPISAACVSKDKRWLATADIGNECMIIVWDTEKSLPIKTLFDVDKVGIRTLCFSEDAKYIASLGACSPQILSIWNWTTGEDLPCVTLSMEPRSPLQNYVFFNPTNPFSVVSNSPDQVIFYRWKLDGEVSFCAPELDDQDFNKTVGLYSQTIYQPNSLTALTATSQGNIVVWVKSSGSPSEMKASKIVRLQEKSITVLTTIKEWIVTADVNGYVKFFDYELKLINWYKQLGCQGAVNSVSFTYMEEEKIEKHSGNSIVYNEDGDTEYEEGNYPTKSTLKAKPFVVNDFSVSTDRAQYLYFQANGSKTLFLREESEKDIQAISCHPRGSFIAIGGFDGLLRVVDFETKELVQKIQYTEYIKITCLSYSADGEYLAVGFDTGHVEVLDSVTLQVEGLQDEVDDSGCKFHFSNGGITHMAFSHDAEYLACADEDNCVVVFVANPKDTSYPWKYLGKHRAHYKRITDLMFLKSLDECKSRLLSIGEDRILVEYDLEGSSLDDLRILTSDRIEQDSVPMSLNLYPSVVKESFLLVSDDQYKLKLFNATTKMCRHTFLGPTYGSPIQRIIPLPKIHDAKHRYMAYSTYDKVGLSILPLDGNPYKNMALIAHPKKVHNLVCSYDGKYVFTSGGHDSTVLMWKVNVDALEATAALGGEGLTPFYTLIEGGREGELFSELEEYFYYAQMKNQGVDSMDERSVSVTIPLCEIPFVMRALGFYPSEQQIEEMMNEVKFSDYVRTGKYVENIDLEALIKLYINHRPAFGLHPSQLVEAFEKIGFVGEDNNIAVPRTDLLKILQEKGEHITESELAEFLAHLFGDDEEDDHPISLEERLPQSISLDMFAKQLLGFNLS